MTSYELRSTISSKPTERVPPERLVLPQLDAARRPLGIGQREHECAEQRADGGGEQSKVGSHCGFLGDAAAALPAAPAATLIQVNLIFRYKAVAPIPTGG